MCKNLPELYNPTDNDILIVSTDACITHWGATLTALTNKALEKTEKLKELITQKTSLKQKKLVKYNSGTFTATQQNYPIHELETLAAIKAFKKWQIDLRPITFYLRTDSKYLIGFQKYNIKANYNQGRLIRWQMQLSQYSYIPVYIKGELNSIADSLTREYRNQLSKD